MQRRSLVLLAILVTMALLAACTGPSSAPGGSDSKAADSGKTWTLKMSVVNPTTAPLYTAGHKPWADDVERVTNGRVKVQIYPNDTLMATKDAYDGVASGLADVALFYGWIQPGRFDRLDVTQLPFMFKNAEAGSRTAWAVFNKFPEIQEQWKDVKVLAVWTTDPYVFITAKKQIKTMEDFAGMKMRMPGGVATEMVKMLGGTPVSVAMNETYENLQKGVMDGMGAPGEAVLGFRLYEVAPFYTMVPSVPAHQQLIMNKKTWDSFPKDIQDQIMSVSGEYQSVRYGAKAFDAPWAELEETVKRAGHKMNTYTPPKEEVDRWKAAVQPLYTKWVSDMKAKGLTNAQEIVDYTLEMAAKYNK